MAWEVKRFFYYTAFKFSQGAFVAIGIGYNGEDSDRPWDRIVTMYIFEAETATNANSYIRAWNHRVHLWTKHYLSERLVGDNGRPGTL